MDAEFIKFIIVAILTTIVLVAIGGKFNTLDEEIKELKNRINKLESKKD